MDHLIGLIGSTEDRTQVAFAIVTCIASGVQALLVFALLIWQRRRATRVAERERDAVAAAASIDTHSDDIATTREQVDLVTLLPIYVAIMWIIVIAGILTATWRVLNMWGSKWGDLLVTRCVEWTIYHFATEGVVFVLLQPGGGVAALRRALILSLIWSAFTFTYFYVITITSYDDIPDMFSFEPVVRAAYDGIVAAGYLIIVVSPSAWFMRRPSVILYARALVVFTIVRIILEVSASVTDGVDAIDYIRAGWECAVALMMPPLTIRTLLTDSQYWHGLAQGPLSAMGVDGVTLRTPLLGLAAAGGGALKAGAAGALALDLDALAGAKVPILNYAFLNLGDSKKGLRLLGVGGTARVFQATYRGQLCAAKLVYLPELTPADIRRFVHEANKLYAFKGHPNVVQLMGVAVWPPALALVMELCPYGSLYDVLHQRAPSTERRDRTSSIAATSVRASRQGSALSLTRDKPSISSTAGVSRSASFSGNGRRNSNSNNGSYHPPNDNEECEASTNTAPSLPPIELNWRTRLLLAWQCSKGVAALHAHHMPLVHLDLKSTNFLVGHAVGRTQELCFFEAKVADFQLSLTRDDLTTVTEVPQTLNWTAPELLPESKGGTGVRTSLHQPYNASFNSGSTRSVGIGGIGSPKPHRNDGRPAMSSPKSPISSTGRTISSSLLSLKTDCWALGMVLYEIGTGMVPFQQSRQPELGQRGLARADTISDITSNNYRPLIPADIDRRYASLMRDLWSTSAADRPTAQQAADRLFKMLVTDFDVDPSHSNRPFGDMTDYDTNDSVVKASVRDQSTASLGNDSFVIIGDHTGSTRDDSSVTRIIAAIPATPTPGIHSPLLPSHSTFDHNTSSDDMTAAMDGTRSSLPEQSSDRSAAAAAFRHSSRATPIA